VHATRACGDSNIASRILNLSSIWRRMISTMPRSVYVRGKSRRY